jgi:hypothetical protein
MAKECWREILLEDGERLIIELAPFHLAVSDISLIRISIAKNNIFPEQKNSSAHMNLYY